MLELIVQIPRGSKVKAEFETQLYYDRLLNIPMVENYGFINGSKLQPDGDLADFYLISNQILCSNIKIKEGAVRLLGVYSYLDKGQVDDKYVYCITQELDENPSFIRHIAYKLSCIHSYLRYYKNDTNTVSKLVLSDYWLNHPRLVDRLSSEITVEIVSESVLKVNL